MFSRPGRKTHSDRPGEGEAQKALRPRSPTEGAIKLRPSDWCPTEGAIKLRPSDWCPAAEAINPNRQDWCPAAEAINSNRQTGVQRQKGLSLQPPNVPGGRRAYHSNPPNEAEDEGLITPSIRPTLPAKGLVTPHQQHPSWATFSVQPGL